MRFIEKKKAPGILLRYIEIQNRGNMHPTYNGLRSDAKGKTIKIVEKHLYKEQHKICCYCNRYLDDDYHVEHFLPQSKFKKDEVAYDNLFLSCNSSFTCGKVKKDLLISKYITYPNCQDLIKYETNGEILPINSYKTIEKCYQNWNSLTIQQKDILLFIETLKLNNKSLIEYRKNIYKEDYPKELERLELDTNLIKNRIIEIENNHNPDFYKSVLQYWLKQYISKLK